MVKWSLTFIIVFGSLGLYLDYTRNHTALNSRQIVIAVSETPLSLPFFSRQTRTVNPATSVTYVPMSVRRTGDAASHSELSTTASIAD